MELAMYALKNPADSPAEIALLAVQLAWCAWNQSLGAEPRREYFEGVRAITPAQRGRVWRYFRFSDAESAVDALCKEKVVRFPDDNRLIVECTMTPSGVVKAKWKNTFTH